MFKYVVAQRLSLCGLLLFSASLFISTAMANVALLLILLAACFDFRHCWVTVKKQPLFYISLVFIAYLVIRQSLGYVYPGGEIGDIKPWVVISLFWLIGWALIYNPKMWKWFLLVACFSFGLRLVLGFDLTSVQRSLTEGYNFGFGINSRVATIGFGLYAGTFVLGWLVWNETIIQKVPKRWRILSDFCWFIALVLLAEVLIMTNSRGAWLATIIAVAFMASLAGLFKVKQRILLRNLVLLVLGGLMIYGLNHNSVSQRAGKEMPTYKAIFAGELSKIPYTSIGTRVHIYTYGVELIKQRPFLGWGAKSSKQLLKHSPDNHIHRYPHFHSGYFQVAVQLGLVGVLLFWVVVFLLMKGLYYSYKRDPDSIQYVRFLLSGIVMMLVWNLTDVRLEHQDYRVYSLFMLGLAFAVISRSTTKVNSRLSDA